MLIVKLLKHPRPLFQPLNDAVMAISGRLFPEGFDLTTDPARAAGSLDQLNQMAFDHHLERRWLTVYSGHSHDTIFGDPAVNHAFRAWHDWTHWAEQAEFDAAGEAEVCRSQGIQAHAVAAPGSIQRIRQLLRAEIVGQTAHFGIYGAFPVRQREFSLAYCFDAKLALSTGAW